MARLDQICTLNMGQSPDSSSYNEVGEGIPFFKGNADFGNLHPKVRVWCSAPTKIARTGDVLISVRAPIGALNIADRECCIGRGLAALTVNEGLCVKDYLWHAIASKVDELNNKGTGSTFKAISKSMLAETDIPLPSLAKQLKIAEELTTVDKMIALRKEQLAKLDQLVKSRFIEMFGDPVLNQHGWQKTALEANATLLNGRAYKQDELLDSGKYPVLRVGNFFSNRGWYYSDLELDDDKYCDNGDLLYAWSASFGPQIWNGGKVIYHYHIWKVLVGEAYNKQFLCKLLEYATESLMGDTHGIAMMHLTKSGMEKTEFIVPPIELQEQFAAFVEQTDKSKLAIQQSLGKLETLKKSLMQEYFG